MFFSQRKYATEIFERAHMVNCNPSRTPVDTEYKLGDDVQHVCLHMHDPREPHFSALKRILRYVRGTLDHGLQLFSPSTTSLVTYTDPDWVDFPTTRRSTSGYCVFFGNILLSWSSTRQPTLSRSSADAEYRGVANAVVETCWLSNLLRESHIPLSPATLVYYNNVSAIYFSSNSVQHQQTKHIEIDIHFFRDLVVAGEVRVLHVPSRYQYADIFTKGLPSTLFEKFRISLTFRCPPAQSAGSVDRYFLRRKVKVVDRVRQLGSVAAEDKRIDVAFGCQFWLIHRWLLLFTPASWKSALKRVPVVASLLLSWEKPSVSTWWKTTKKHQTKATKSLKLKLGKQISDEKYSFGKSLTDKDIFAIASKGETRNAINIVLTASDVLVDGFCSSRCESHGSSPASTKTVKGKNYKFAYIWVGNSETQCPRKCTWPFHKPIYGLQVAPLVAPNNDVNVDGMVINLASLLDGTATNPFGNGYYQGDEDAPLEATSVCPGVYTKGAYHGYAGDLLIDATTGASYNAHGTNRRKYVLSALYDPSSSTCFTLV
ncbi:ribonuclease H-like domain-containing protein [Tanacetum coccineum]|uniref:Ribonuclease H-like domain-containing protein n=1 Tax=Tanacetum coccineum TaxID=301880 RepID=A0ABQ4XUQ4_9ASTR